MWEHQKKSCCSPCLKPSAKTPGHSFPRVSPVRKVAKIQADPIIIIMVPFVTSQRADFHKPKKEKMDLCHFSAGHTEDNFIDDAAGITLKTSQTATVTQ